LNRIDHTIVKGNKRVHLTTHYHQHTGLSLITVREGKHFHIIVTNPTVNLSIQRAAKIIGSKNVPGWGEDLI